MKRVRNVVIAVVVVATTGLAVAFVSRPWSAAALAEGYPSRTWPAEGNFVQQGEILDPDPVPRPSQLGSDFETAFADSGGMAFVVAEAGEVIFAKYGEDYGADTEFNSYSMAKSLVGLLAIKALSDGAIEGLDTTIGELWSDPEGSEITSVTVGELLDMKSGIAFEKSPGDVGQAATEKKEQAATFGPFSQLAKLHVEGVDAVVDEARLIEADRGRFSYQNLNTALLGRVLEEVHGKPLEQLLYDTIAEPSGAGGFRWRQYRSAEQVSAYCCLFATTQWWVAVAAFVMNNGIDQPFLTEEWHAYVMGRDLTTDEIHDGAYRTQLHYNVLDRDGESLQGPFVYFSGLGGQTTYLVPDADLVVVRFGERYQLLHSTLYQAGYQSGSQAGD